MTAIRNIAELRELRRRLAQAPNVRTTIARRVAVELSKLARADYDAGRSPSGQQWRPGKDGKAVTLRRSGTLEAAAVAYRAIGSVVRATVSGVRYAKYQLSRGILPRKLPDAWLARVEAISEEELRRHMGAAL